MGCVHCGRRQVDPDSGPSTWRRAVLGGEQVLVCPTCQSGDWTAGLDRCSACASTVLVKRLGDVVCRSCGHEVTPAAERGSSDPSPVREALTRDVAAALDRVLGRD
jgi:hypothetical protein